ncbi:ribosome small subunit-dependent GTPase A [Anaerocolumna chitinilytica]|uniref:Small ribosomal subunit biogenesis GTPase RsgA n=1 Tax=Anaerocolumna chitinilytica TaxID=1727145 RepID=A0A7I8DP64_9FIRM|nr:ribosome small subunit-dependent GTPase A [Anaerocolumna chitinilytica]BCK00199.1 putative ribosome biogenesis GTPase RsgA [Anaerocolumna chitinilytica]
MTGKIIKGIGGFYYVFAENGQIYECKAKGIFRNQNIKPLVGDDVLIDVLEEETMKGNITDILERRNELIRPAVANVDQAMIIFAAAKPAPNLNLLDRFLILMLRQKVDTIICFNKKDVVSEKEIALLEETYRNCGYHTLFTSTYTEEGITALKDLLAHKTTVLAGPSGVGKSSIVNLVSPDANTKTGEISEKIQRGKHTTRHSELISIGEDGFVMDTPGFSSLYLSDMEKDELKDFFPEFMEYSDECRFLGCMHLNEPDCKVKEALKQGKISKIRYKNYKDLYEELNQKKKKF